MPNIPDVRMSINNTQPNPLIGKIAVAPYIAITFDKVPQDLYASRKKGLSDEQKRFFINQIQEVSDAYNWERQASLSPHYLKAIGYSYTLNQTLTDVMKLVANVLDGVGGKLGDDIKGIKNSDSRFTIEGNYDH